MLRGRIFNVQRFSLEDGPGIRTTVFLKGCPLRCAWCHNPEGLASDAELRWLSERCILCGECQRVCPVEPDRSSGSGPVPIGLDECTLCGACVEACPTDARKMVGREVRVDALMEELLADRMFFEESGGGVSFSGGEPFHQAGFLLAVLQACRGHELHTVVDTSGFVETGVLLAAVPWTDLFLYDLKMMDSKRHAEFTRVPNRLILDNLRALSQAGAKACVRVPILPGINDRQGDLEALAEFVLTLPQPFPVQLLPYHQTALHKFRALDQTYHLNHVVPPSIKRLHHAAAMFHHRGLVATVGGGSIP